LKEKEDEDKVPVPLNSIPVTVEEAIVEAAALFTVTTVVRSLAVVDVVPGNTIPLRV
jgi:hypothetical protein